MKVLIIAVVIILFFLFVSYIINLSSCKCDRLLFTPEAWNKNPSKRYCLVDSLILSNKLIGKTKNDIKSLLGDEFNGKYSDLWRYYIGRKPGVRLFFKRNLHIVFENNIVVKVLKK